MLLSKLDVLESEIETFESKIENEGNFKFKLLESTVLDILKNDISSAVENIERLGNLISLKKSDDLIYVLFSNAILKRIRKLTRKNRNLYLVDFETRQIDLFELVAKRMPYITVGEILVNRYLSNHICNNDPVVLVDIGIGTGRQVMALLEYLSEIGKAPKQIKIVGIDPAEGAMKEAGCKLKSFAERLDCSIQFVPFVKSIECLTSADWGSIRKLGRNLIVNDSFALHHVRLSEKFGDMKDVVLERIRNLEPLIVVLSEPHSDHETTNFMERFHNAWKHFRLVFDTIDRLDIDIEERAAIKRFFSREIEDIVGNSENIRSERHETAEMWLARLKKLKFSVDPNFLSKTPLGPVDGIHVSNKADYIGLDVQGETVVSLIAVK